MASPSSVFCTRCRGAWKGAGPASVTAAYWFWGGGVTPGGEVNSPAILSYVCYLTLALTESPNDGNLSNLLETEDVTQLDVSPPHS